MNSKNVFTRMCIGEAVVKLLKKMPYDKLRITAVARKAGVSRMTFYKYYETIYDALTDYLNIIIIEYIDACKNNSKNGSFRDSGSILFALNFFDRYREFFLTLSGHGLHSILIKGINDFMSKYYVKGKNYSSYSLYCYAGGLLNVCLKWEEEGCSQPAEEVAKMLYELYNSMK